MNNKIKLEVLLYIPDEPIDTDVTRILAEEWYDTDNSFFELEDQIKNIINEQKN